MRGTSRKRAWGTAWAVILLVAASCGVGDAREGAPLVRLEAAGLPEGPLGQWANAGALGGVFDADGTTPQVRVVDGVRAVDFSGSDYMKADFTAPAAITGDGAWTAVAQVYGRDISGERALVSWANRPVRCLSLGYGDSLLYGALGTWDDPNVSGWDSGVPEPKAWHTLVYVYEGGTDGEFQAWCDGALRASKRVTLSTKPGRTFSLGATMLGGDDPEDEIRWVHRFDGAIAGIRIYDRAMSRLEVWNASGMDAACLEAPENGARLEALTTTLQWFAGDPGTAAFDLYLGLDATAVAEGEAGSGTGGADAWESVYKGRFPVDTTEFGPLALALGTTYHWRVDQVDAAGEVMQRSAVASFRTETGNARDPQPSSGYILVEGGEHTLRWVPGKYAVRQNLFFGESEREVREKTTPDVAGLPATADAFPWPVQDPEPGKPYYWRVESINPDGMATSSGDVWSVRVVKRTLKVYLAGGQSNMVGCTPVEAGFPEELIGENPGALIFVRGECRIPDYGWAYVRHGLGSPYNDRGGLGTFGPELVFAAEMAPDDPAEVIAIIKCAWGGTTLGAQWLPPGAGGVTGPLYEGFVKAVHEGIAALDPAFEPVIAGMLWMQGESDSGSEEMARDYARNLTQLIGDLRQEFEAPEMPFVVAQITVAPPWDGEGRHGERIRAAQREAARTVPFTATFPTEGWGMCDPFHYDMEGMLALGKRFAEAMKRIETEGKR